MSKLLPSVHSTSPPLTSTKRTELRNFTLMKKTQQSYIFRVKRQKGVALKRIGNLIKVI